MNASEITGRILVSIITTVVLAVLVLLWSWLTTGGLLERIGGLKKEEIISLVDNKVIPKKDIKKLIEDELKQPGKFDELVKKEVSRQLSGVHLPSGAVVAFEQVKCPEGWASYNKADGRFIVGVGQDTLRKHLNVGEKAGNEYVTLRIENMPVHQHGTIIHASSKDTRGWGNGNQINPVPATTRGTGKWEKDGGFFLTSPVGEGKPHYNMPPFIALRFCQNVRQ